MRKISPASHDTPLGLAYSNVVSNDKEFDLVYLGWVLSSELLLGKTKVKHVPCVIPSRESVDPLMVLMEGLLDNNKSTIDNLLSELDWSKLWRFTPCHCQRARLHGALVLGRGRRRYYRIRQLTG